MELLGAGSWRAGEFLVWYGGVGGEVGKCGGSLVHFAVRVVFPACCFSTDWRHFSTRNRMAIQKVGVVGCGLMGSGIAQVCAQTGFPTVVREVSAEIVEKGLKNIEKNLARLVEKGTISEAQKGEIRGGLKGTTAVEDLKDCDLIVEAIIW